MGSGHWYDSVKPGDLVVTDPLWNETTAVRYRRLPRCPK